MPVQWSHWVLTKDLNTRRETHVMYMPIAPHWPPVVRWYARAFDIAQSWLIHHHVCMRHQEHKVFWQTQLSVYPPREEGMKIPRTAWPVCVRRSVGVPSWTMPHVSIIDRFGLNDYVIARTPLSHGTKRQMAHSRRPPKGYIDSFRPNVAVRDRRIIISDRTQPITADYITANERYWRGRLKGLEQPDAVDKP